MRLLINKGGMVFRTRAANTGGSATGEVGETEGLIRHLVARGHDLVYFGRCVGELPCPIVQSCCPADLSEWSTSAYQKECFAEDIKNLEPYGPFAGLIQVCGYSPTFSHIDNPRGAIVQASGVRYSAPTLNVIQHFKLKRICVNNDPRTYPKDQEMSYGWDYCRPAALLDQCGGDTLQTVGGRKYIRRSVYAGCESWAYLDRLPNTHGECTVVAHAHIKDGCKQAARDASWVNVLQGTPYKVYGKGWEHFSLYDDQRFMGPVNPSKVPGILSNSIASPCVAQENFYTGKPYVLWASGCVPILYGDGKDPYTWDPKEIFLPLNHPWRINRPGDLDRAISSIGPAHYEFWERALQPRWQVIDALVDDLLAGKELNYGGYLRLH